MTSTPNINNIGFIAFPRELIVGILTEGTTPESVHAAIVEIGIAPERIHFLQGDEGLRILNPEGASGPLRERVQRKIEGLTHEGDVLHVVADHLRAGGTAVGVHEVSRDEEPRVREAAAAHGVEHLTYLGKWTIA